MRARRAHSGLLWKSYDDWQWSKTARHALVDTAGWMCELWDWHRLRGRCGNKVLELAPAWLLGLAGQRYENSRTVRASYDDAASCVDQALLNVSLLCRSLSVPTSMAMTCLHRSNASHT